METPNPFVETTNPLMEMPIPVSEMANPLMEMPYSVLVMANMALGQIAKSEFLSGWVLALASRQVPWVYLAWIVKKLDK